MKLDSRSVALLLVIALIIVVTILSAVGLNFSLSNYKLPSYSIDGIKSFYLAEALIQRGIYKIKNKANPVVNNYEWIFENQKIYLTITVPDPANPHTYKITSTNSYGNISANKKIEATVKKDTPVELLEWRLLN